MQEFTQIPRCRNAAVRKVTHAHGLQILEVRIAHGGEIPLHAHECGATMIITQGDALKLTKDGPGERVRPGDVVTKAPKEFHGFTDIGADGFQFISLSNNDGIIHDDGSMDMIFA